MTLQAANGPDRWVSPDGMIDLRLGRWQDVLADVEECDAVITDVPYSERTISGQRSGGARDVDGWQGPNAGAIRYAPWTREDARVFSSSGLVLRARWVAVFCDHIIFRWLEEEFAHAGWMTFQPVPWVKQDAAPRLIGDGPSPQSETLFVARPRGPFAARYRKGWYSTKQDRTGIVTGGKPLDLMRAVVRDYSEPGDLVVDPFCGGATTAIACRMEGRRCITSEQDPETFAKALARVKRGVTPDLFSGVAS